MTTVEFKLGGTLRFLIEEEIICLVTLRYDDGFTVTAKGQGMVYKLANDHVVDVQVTYVDAKGHPADIDGDVTWESSDENIATVEIDEEDSSMAKIRPGDSVGMVQISATADADLGDGVREIITPMDVEIVGGEAVSGTITPVGEPQPIAPTATPRR